MKKVVDFFNNKYVKYGIWFLLVFISFYEIDFLFRLEVTRLDKYFGVFSLYPNFFDFFWVFVILVILTLTNKKVGKLVYRVLMLVFNIYIFAQLIHYNILGRLFNVYDIFSVGEGAEYFGSIFQYLCNTNYLVILFSLAICFVTDKLWFNERLNNRKLFVLLFSVFFLAMYFRTASIYYMGDIVEDTWNSNEEASKVYSLYSNPTSSLEVSGLYEFVIRDLYLFISNNGNISIEDISDINNYLDNRDYNNDNKYSSFYKDKNIIMIMLESVDNTFLNKDVMPNLNELKTKSLYFTNRYSPIFGIGATFNSEFTSLTGTYSSTVGKAAYFYTNNDYKYSLVNLFKNSGYAVNSFHMNKGSFYDRNTMHTSIGFNKYNSFYNYTNKYLYSDSEILDYDNIYNDIVKDDKFFSYIVTYSAHMPYNDGNMTCVNHMNNNFINDDEETACFKSALYDTDKFIGNLINKLKDDNKLDDTIIILYGDHLAYSYTQREDYGGNENYDLNKGVYMIYDSSSDGKKIETVNTTIDMVPTIANLFGLEGYNANNYLGVDVFNKDALHVAYFSDYNWFDGKVYSADLSNKDYLKNKKYYDTVNNYVTNSININNEIVMGNFYKYR